MNEGRTSHGGDRKAFEIMTSHVQLLQGFIHDDHEDLIKKHGMMIRVTDNI
jgi:hypothetical protein